MTPTTPPSHLSEPLFRRYEPLIAKAVARHPLATPFDLHNIRGSTVTFIARFRDSINSLERYRWKTSIPLDLFLSANLKVAYRPPFAIVGSATAIREYDKAPSTLDATLADTRVPFILPSCSDIRLLCLLASNKQLLNPIQLSIPPEMVDNLLDTFDIDLEDLGNGQFILT